MPRTPNQIKQNEKISMPSLTPEKTEHFDAAVVGAGLAGLLTAAMLARSGLRVLVLEREEHPGGRLRSFETREGVVLDAGAYLWPNAWLDDAFEHAGVTGFRASTIPPDQVMRLYVEGHAGKRYAFPWPARPASAKVLETARVALGADAALYQELSGLWVDLARAAAKDRAPLSHAPADAALSRRGVRPELRRAFLRNVMCFGTAAPGAASLAECAGLLRAGTADRAARPQCAGPNPEGGVRALVGALVKAADAAGVELRCGWAVETVRIDEGRARGLLARRPDGSTHALDAEIVVSSLPAERIFDVVPTSAFSAEFVRDARSWSAIGGVVACAFLFKGLPRLRETGEPDRFLGWTRFLTGPEAEFGGGALWTTHHSPHNAPPGHHVLQAMRLSRHDEIDDPSRVAEIQRAFDTLVAEVYADAGEKLVWKKEWVTHDGTEYLVNAAPRPPVEAPGVSGLFFVGETTDVPAVQMDAAALSALRCADLALGKRRATASIGSDRAEGDDPDGR